MSPLDLLELDDSMLASLGEAYSAQRWGDTQELLAVLAELVHALIRVTVKANSPRGTQVPQPLHIKRPNEPAMPSMSIGEMARRMARG